MSSIKFPQFTHITTIETPTDGIPELTYTPWGLKQAIAALRQGNGPVAIDTEFAQGIRYDGRAFLVQLRRNGAGTWIIDAEALGDLSGLSAALEDTQWIVHAAAQDLLALEKRNMHPGKLFDTEIAAKLLGIKKSSLSTVAENFLGKKLAKEHQLHDWSQRPLPQAWLNYAALDVELLIPLQSALANCLEEAGRLEWAIAESEFIRRSYSVNTPTQRKKQLDSWRKTSHLSSLKTNRQYAIVRELWFERDKIAHAKDVHPKKVLSDRALITLAQQSPRTIPQFFKVPGMLPQRKQARRWLDSLQRAYRLEDSELPPLRLPASGPPPNSFWPQKKAAAANRLQLARQSVNGKAEDLKILPENLLSPEIVRKLSWQEPPEPLDLAYVLNQLECYGARQWQIELTAADLLEALKNAPCS